LLAPLALVPYPAAATLLTLATIALLATVLRVFLRRLAGPAAASPWALAWLLPPALFLEPVRDTLSFGQVNVVLMTLVSLDCLAETPRWPRGALTGLAAAVKLTPAAFVLFFLLRGDYRAAARAGLSFAAVTAIGFAAAWHDSVRYWTSTVYQPGRAGSPASASNQCILAVLARGGLDPHLPTCVAAWLVLSAVVVIVASRGMRSALAASEECLALVLNAFAALLISPISWSHHWVWCDPALLTIATLASRYRSRLALAACITGAAVFAAAPQFSFPRGLLPEIRWGAWQQPAGSSYVLFAALLLLASAALTRRRLTGNSPCPQQPFLPGRAAWQTTNPGWHLLRRPGQLRAAGHRRQPTGPQRRGPGVQDQLRQGAEQAPGGAGPLRQRAG
jgi:alpha-1,2-mannosyltransferase